jgi:outer membrane immunogenic protein
MVALEAFVNRFGWVLGSIISIGSFGGAMAADMALKAPPPPAVAAYNWTGFYVGVNGGWAFDNRSGSLDSFTTAPGADFAPAVAAGTVPRDLGANHEGGFGGGQIGYNWQRDRWVFGLEADIQGADIGRTNTISLPGVGGFSPTVTMGRDHIDWFGTARGRIGVAANTVLFYATGGLAFGGVNTNVSFVANPAFTGNFAGASSDTRTGWVAGAGVEWAFAPHWSVKGEYLHVDLGSSNTTIFDPVNFPLANATYRFHHEFDAVRAGVNYAWGGPVVAKY